MFDTHTWWLQLKTRLTWPLAGQILVLVVGLGGVLGGIGSLYHAANQAQATTSNNCPVIESAASNSSSILIDVSGGVNQPGVYQLQPEQRAIDAITAAGGFSDQADQDQVNQYLNLASPLTDGQKIYIPLQGEANPASANLSSAISKSSSDNLISINTATATELESLPNIGTARVQTIIAGRPYQQLDELVSHKIIPASIYEKIKPQISL